jgi:hypothetical protein
VDGRFLLVVCSWQLSFTSFLPLHFFAGHLQALFGNFAHLPEGAEVLRDRRSAGTRVAPLCGPHRLADGVHVLPTRQRARTGA